MCRHAGLLPLGSLGSEWYLRAFRGGCDYGGSGQVLRVAFWYHSVRLRCHHAMVARRLLRLQFCVWVSAAVTRPGIPVPGLSVCALPSSLHPSPTPPAPPFQGVAGGGSWAVEIGIGSDARSWIRLELADGPHGCVPGCCMDIPSCFSCSSPLWGAWVDVAGLAVGSGDMQAVYSPHGQAAD